MSEWPSIKKAKFYVYIFPSTDIDWKSVQIDIENGLIYVKELSKPSIPFRTKSHPKFWCFNTDGIFWNCCQAKIYSSVMEHIFNKLFIGMDNLVLSCGQTFSGKTFTMSGFNNQYELRGIIPRFVTDLFMNLEAKTSDYTSQIWISAIEINKNQIYDLLSNPKKCCKAVKEINTIEIYSEDHCLDLLLKAEAQRMVIKHKRYTSNVGAYILKFKIILLPINANKCIDIIDTVTFVDLAGIGNDSSNITGKQSQDNANLTKYFLGLFALRSQKSVITEKHVNITNSMDVLIKYLEKSLSPNSYKSLICHIRPTCKGLKFTLSTLKFGSIFHGIPVERVELPNSDDQINKLKEKISELNDELILSDLKESDPIEGSSMQLTQGRVKFVKRAVKHFLNDKLSQDDLLALIDDHDLIVNVLKSERIKTHRKVNAKTQTNSFVMELHSKKVDEQEINQTNQKDTNNYTIVDKGEVSIGKKLSAETQVNLIEPNIKLPYIDSKERLWQKFLFSRPEIQERLDNLYLSYPQNVLNLSHKVFRFNDIRQSDEDTEIHSNVLGSCRKLEKIRNFHHLHHHQYHQLEKEIELAEVFVSPHGSLEANKLKELYSEPDWLEALKKLDIEKMKIEEEFKQYCISNNFIYIDEIPNLKENTSDSKNIFDNHANTFHSDMYEDHEDDD